VVFFDTKQIQGRVGYSGCTYCGGRLGNAFKQIGGFSQGILDLLAVYGKPNLRFPVIGIELLDPKQGASTTSPPQILE